MVRIKVEKVNDIAVEANLSPKNDSFEILLTELQQSKPERKENEEREREREYTKSRERNNEERECMGRALRRYFWEFWGFYFLWSLLGKRIANTTYLVRNSYSAFYRISIPNE